MRALTSDPNITENSHTWFADDRESLLHPDNVNFEALKQYASEAASFSTSHFSTPLPTTPLAEWKGREDVSIFDFTHIYSSQVTSAADLSMFVPECVQGETAKGSQVASGTGGRQPS